MQVFLEILAVFLFGSAIGSFLNVVILRLPKGEKITGRSHCNFCGHELAALDLIPLLSYAVLLGKCRYCRKAISARYFLIEGICGALFVWAYFFIQPGNFFEYLILLKYLFVICICLITFVVDLEHFIILSNVVLGSTGVLFFLNLLLDFAAGNKILSFNSIFTSGLTGSLLAPLPILLLWYGSKFKSGETGQWMGFGDVELMVFLGAALGWRLAFVNLFLAVLAGGVISVILIVFSNKNLKSRVPFGVFLTPAALLAMFYGERLLTWYLSLLGI